MSELVNSYIDHVENSILKAEQHQSKLHQGILAIQGMSGSKTRHLYNNICSLTRPKHKTKYLEVGTWMGSSFVSAVYGNDHLNPVCIDNWSEFGGPREQFYANCKEFLPKSMITVIEGDCFKVAKKHLGDEPIDIYLYDGGHQEGEHKAAITHMWKFLASPCIVIVDDWNWEVVKKGTYLGFAEVGAKVHYSIDVGSDADNDHRGYWNGAGIFVVGK
jgi:predicted O-methyltransferase YrrM